jgi:hypothetical protein
VLGAYAGGAGGGASEPAPTSASRLCSRSRSSSGRSSLWARRLRATMTPVAATPATPASPTSFQDGRLTAPFHDGRLPRARSGCLPVRRAARTGDGETFRSARRTPAGRRLRLRRARAVVRDTPIDA